MTKSLFGAFLVCLILVITQVGGIHVPDNIPVQRSLTAKLSQQNRNIFKLADHIENNIEAMP